MTAVELLEKQVDDLVTSMQAIIAKAEKYDDLKDEITACRNAIDSAMSDVY